MKNRKVALICILLSFCALPARILSAEDAKAAPAADQAAQNQQAPLPCVGIIPLDAESGKPDLVPVASSLSDFLSIDFKISGRVAVKGIKRPVAEDFTSSIPQIIKENRLDYLLFGLVHSEQGGGIEINVFMYDAQGGKLSAGYQKVAELFELSDAGDSLFAALSKNVGTIHHGFGRIDFVVEGVGSYEVFMNGESLGRNLPSLDNVLNGRHFIEVKQSRPFGTVTLVSGYVDMAEGARESVKVSLPVVLPEELARVGSTVNMIEDKWEKEDSRADVEAAIASLEDAFSDISSCPGVVDLAAKTRQLRALWKSRELRYAMEANPLVFELSSFDELKPVFAGASDCPDPEAIRSSIRENLSIASSLQSMRAVAAASEGDWRRALDIYRLVSNYYEAFGLELPAVYARDIAFLEGIDSLYAKSKLERASSAKAYSAARVAGLGLLALASGSLAANLPEQIRSSDPGDHLANLSAGLGRDGLIAFENLGILAGTSLFAYGRSGQYRGDETERVGATAAARTYFGRRLADASALSSALSAPSGLPALVIFSDRPEVPVKLDKEASRPAPFAFTPDGSKAEKAVVLQSGTLRMSVAIESRRKFVFLPAEAADDPEAQEIAVSRKRADGSVGGSFDLSWPAVQGASSYRCIVYSKAPTARDSSITVIDCLNGVSLRYYATVPGRALCFVVYAVDRSGSSSELGRLSLNSPARLPLGQDRSFPVHFGLALGGSASSSPESAGAMTRVEPSLLCNLVPGSFMFGLACRFDLSGSEVASWGLSPLAVSGDLDGGAFHLFKAGVSYDGTSSKYSIDFGYGEGVERLYLMPSLDYSSETASQSAAFGFSFVLGYIL